MFKPIFKEMFHPSKSAIISSLKKSNGLPVSDVAKKVDMSYMGVKQHCINLEKMGFLESWRVPRKEVGRPEKLYRLTKKGDELFPDIGSEVTLALLDEVKDIFGESVPEKILLNYFDKKKTEWLKILKKKPTIVEKAKVLSELREEDGYFNDCQFDQALGLVIKEYHNPMKPIFEKYPNTVRFELEMIEELLGTTVKRECAEGSHGQKLSMFKINTLGKKS